MEGNPENGMEYDKIKVIPVSGVAQKIGLYIYSGMGYCVMKKDET